MLAAVMAGDTAGRAAPCWVAYQIIIVKYDCDERGHEEGWWEVTFQSFDALLVSAAHHKGFN